MENQNKQKKPWYKKWWGIVIIFTSFVIFSLLSGFTFLILNIINNPGNYFTLSAPALEQETLETINGKNNFYLGKKDSPKIVIVEFADFACPMCKNSFTTLRNLIFEYKDDIKLIFRDYPSVSAHSADLSLAARCAGEQGLFWVMHDKLFINQGVDTKTGIKNLAAQIGADTEKFNSCFDKELYMAGVYRDYKDGETLGIKGTPTFFVNGYEISGNISEEYWEKIINAILNQ